MRRLRLDFETASATDLRLAGAHRYAECPTTEVISLTFRLAGDEECHLWTPDVYDWHGDSRETLLEYCANPEVLFVAHNAAFEKAIWRHIMVEVFNFPDVPNERWHCTQAACAMHVIPQDLDRSLLVLRLPFQKDKEGSKLAKALSKPRKDGTYDRSEATLARIYEYNRSDILGTEVLDQRLGDLPAGERAVWLLDQRINERGVRLDLGFVQAAQAVVDRASVPLLREFAALTGGLTPGQNAKFMEWLRAQGVHLPNLQKETLAALLGDEDEDGDDAPFDDEIAAIELPDTAERALHIRQLVGSASVKKLARMQACVCNDGRARGLLQYHGAGPGLWAGRLFQPQNFPRGTLRLDDKPPPPALVVEAISTRDPEYVGLTLGPPVESVVHGLRHALVAAPGRLFVSADLSGIQARTVLALAGQFDKSQLMASGADVYCDMASAIFKRPIDKKRDPEERQTGKNCLAGDTLVLTRRGFHPITNVLIEDELWDGLEWVKHAGLVYRGIKPTRLVAGVAATPEHPVLVGGRWQAWADLARDDSILSRGLATASASLSWLDITMGFAAVLRTFVCNALVGRGHIKSWARTCGRARPPDAINVRNVRPDTGVNPSGATPTLCQTPDTVFDYSIGSRPASTDVIIRATKISTIMASVGFKCLNPGVRIAALSWPTWLRSMVGNNPVLNLIASTWTKAISPAIFVLRPDDRIRRINDKWSTCKDALLNLKPVYDLANAGPRHRFTILTSSGPLIVHNSVLGLGFGMGAKKFRFKYAGAHPIEFSENVVNVYRKEWAPEVPKLWRGLEGAAVRAVHDRRPMEAYGIEYRLEDGWLTARLPSGRKIWYFNPQPCRRAMPWDETDIRLAWTYQAMKFGKWKTIDAFGGLLTENVVMGIQRDLMTTAMFKCEENGMPIVLNVHDEIVVEPEQKRADLKALIQIMTDSPQWARALQIPVAAEGWVGDRYHK